MLRKLKRLIVGSLAVVGALTVGVIASIIGSGISQGWGDTPSFPLEED